MKKISVFSMCVCFAIAGSVSSCKKSNSTTPTTPAPTPTSTNNTPTPNVGSVDGVLVSLKTDVTSVTMGIPVSISTESAVASFFTATGSSTMVDGGTVTVNTNALVKQSNNSYVKTASVGMTPADLGFSGGSNWSVGGAGSVPAFTYNHTVSFPTFTGTIPDSITRSSGLTISLSGKVSNADSVILFIAQGSKYITRTVAGSAPSVTVSAADLGTLAVVSDKSALLEVVPYRITMSTQGGKQYAFIKEYAAVKNININ